MVSIGNSTLLGSTVDSIVGSTVGNTVHFLLCCILGLSNHGTAFSLVDHVHHLAALGVLHIIRVVHFSMVSFAIRISAVIGSLLLEDLGCLLIELALPHIFAPCPLFLL